MKLRIFALLMGVVAFATSAGGQDSFTFRNQLRDTVHLGIRQSDVTRHFLGDNVAVKYYRLKETYTYVESASVTNPNERTIVKKPTIYYSLKKLNSHYRKQLKKGKIDSSKAIEELGWYFDIGFAIYDQNTSDFEKALKDAKKPGEIEQLFARVILE